MNSSIWPRLLVIGLLLLFPLIGIFSDNGTVQKITQPVIQSVAPSVAGMMGVQKHINVHFYGVKTTIADREAMFKHKLDEVVEVAKQAGIDGIKLWNTSYTIETQTNGNEVGFSLQGNIVLSVNAAKKDELMKLLREKRFNVSETGWCAR